MSDKFTQTKHHMPKTVRVALKHLAKPEPQTKPVSQRKLRPLSNAQRFEILSRASSGDALRSIVSEMGIPYSLAYKLITGNGISYLTGCIQRVHLVVQDDKQAASLEIDSLIFTLNPERYSKFACLIDNAYIEHLPLFVIAQLVNDSFQVLHLKEGL
jgi:hypothetical protein